MKKLGMSLIAIAVSAIFNSSIACTDFRLTAKDGSVLITRSMEFALDMKSSLRTSTRGRVFSTVTPDGGGGLSWKAKYGYAYLDGLGIDTVIDGINETGLSIETLFMPGYAEYQTIPMGQNSKAVSYANFGDWVLGNFKNVDEVRQAIPSIFVFAQKLLGFGDTIFPIHFAIDDPTGKGIVVEYVAGKLNVYDNKIGVMTNSPDYGWHIKNLANYVHLAPENPSPIVDNGMTFVATGQGFGMIGLPGDISPPSRFVKTVALTRTAIPAEDAAGALNMAEHIINNVDIPKGLVREPNSGNKYTNETTQWVIFKDLTHKMLYYRTYNDLSLRAVSLAKLDFSENAKRLMMPIASAEYIRDMSDQFVKSPQPAQSTVTAGR